MLGIWAMLFELVKIVSQNNMIYIHVDSPDGAVKGRQWVWRRGQAWVANYTRPLPWRRWYSRTWRLCRDEVHKLAGYRSCNWCCKLFCWIRILLILWLLIFTTVLCVLLVLLWVFVLLAHVSEVVSWSCAQSDTLGKAKAQTSIVLMMSANQQHQVAEKLI